MNKAVATGCLSRSRWHHSPMVLSAKANRIILIFSFFLLFLSYSYAQTPHRVKGSVTGDKGEALPGVVIKAGNASAMTITDSAGNFAISVPTENGTLVLSREGYISQEVKLGNNMEMNIQLHASALVLNDSYLLKKTGDVPLLYNLKSPADLNIASIQVLPGEALSSMPGNQLKSVLAGQLPGLFVNQSSSNSGSINESAFSLSLRGQNPLIVIDGIPQNISIFDFNEIESVSVLSDALGTAMYGPQASDGVLLITTKKGEVGKQKIGASVQSSIQKPGRFLRGLHAYDYATLYNEALTNDGLAPVYSQADLDAYKNQSDPLGHPDIDWINQAYKESVRMDRFTMNISGGNRVARYFAVGEYLRQGGIFKTNEAENTYSTNNDLNSYMLRSNVDLNLNEKTNVGINVLSRIIETNEPGATTNTIRNNIYNTPNNAYPILNTDQSLGGALEFKDNIYGQINKSGYRQGYERNLLSQFYLKRTLDELVKGLWTRGVASFSSAFSQTLDRSKTFAVNQMKISPNAGGSFDTSYRRFNSDGMQKNTDGVSDQWVQSYAELDLGYDRKFDRHGVNAILLFNKNSTRINSDLPLLLKGFSGRLAYNFDERYMVEAVFGYNGFNRYPEGFRMRFFPAVGLGWNINRESFMKNLAWVNRLKLYGSYGRTGRNGNGYYSFTQYYVDASNVYFGTTPSGYSSVAEGDLVNSNLDYEKANKLNLGLEGAIWKNRLSFSVEYYNNYYYDLIRTRGNSSVLLGNGYPAENLGKSRHCGWNMTLGWSDQLVSAVSYFISANANVAKSNQIFIDEVEQRYPWMRRTGNQVGQAFGYTALGLYRTPADFTKPGVAAIEGYTPHLGDIMYKDYDGDGKITVYDEAPIGNTKPLVFFGTTLGASYKGLDFRALVQGVFNRNIVLTGATEWEFQNRGFWQAFEHHLDRWTPTNPDASYPRLSVGTNLNNQLANSSYWYKNGNYGRLKFLELGYTFSAGWMKRMKLESFRLYANATNLFTLSAYKDVDPEVYGNAYPIFKTFSAGLSIKL